MGRVPEAGLQTAIAQIPSWFEQTGNLIFLCASRESVKEEGAESVVSLLSTGSSKWWGKSRTVRCWAGKSWWGFLAEQLWSARSDQLWASRGGLWGDVAVGPEKRNLLGKQRNLRPEAEKASQILGEGDGRQKLASEKKKKERNWLPRGACTSVRE